MLLLTKNRGCPQDARITGIVLEPDDTTADQARHSTRHCTDNAAMRIRETRRPQSHGQSVWNNRWTIVKRVHLLVDARDSEDLLMLDGEKLKVDVRCAVPPRSCNIIYAIACSAVSKSAPFGRTETGEHPLRFQRIGSDQMNVKL